VRPAQVVLRNDRTREILAALRPAVARALNRAIDTTKTDVARKLSAELGLRQAPIKERLRIQRATADRLEATLTVARKPPIALTEYPGVRQVKQGVTRTGKGTIRHAFLATMKSGHVGAFLRKGRRRLPIRELMGPNLPKLAVEKHILESAQAVGEAAFTKNLTHELGRVINP